MKKMVILTMFVALLGSTTQFISAAPPNNDREDGYITINANETAEIEPNQAKITFAVEINNKDIKKASDEMNELAAKLAEVIKSKMSEEDTIKTAAFTVAPQYVMRDKKNQFTGYRATTKMVVTCNKLENVSDIISSALNNGATEVSGLEFISTDYDNTCNELLVKATKNSHVTAALVAKAGNSTLAGIKYINTSCGSQVAPRAYAMMKTGGGNGAEDSVTAGPTIEPGTLKINANVYASFYTK